MSSSNTDEVVEQTSSSVDVLGCSFSSLIVACLSVLRFDSERDLDFCSTAEEAMSDETERVITEVFDAADEAFIMFSWLWLKLFGWEENFITLLGDIGLLQSVSSNLKRNDKRL